MTNQRPTTEKRGPERTAQILLTLTMLGACYLDFFGYRAQGFAALGSLDDRLAGAATAPEQYRLGVVWLAHWMVLHLHVAPTMALASMDGLCGLVAVLVLFRVLLRTEVYGHASVTVRWFGAAAFVLLMQWSLAWLLWLQKPETLPAAMLLALMLWLWQSGHAMWLAKAAAIFCLTLVLATFRADIACLLNAGILLFALSKRGELALGRTAAVVVAGLSALAAAGIQLWLMLVAFPHASYGHVKMLQLWPNIKHGTRWPPFAIFLLPLVWMVVPVVRRRFARDPAGVAFLFGALLYFALWITIGKIDEVRIFLPFAFALTPLTVQMAMLRVEPYS